MSVRLASRCDICNTDVPYGEVYYRRMDEMTGDFSCQRCIGQVDKTLRRAYRKCVGFDRTLFVHLTDADEAALRRGYESEKPFHKLICVPVRDQQGLEFNFSFLLSCRNEEQYDNINDNWYSRVMDKIEELLAPGGLEINDVIEPERTMSDVEAANWDGARIVA